MADRPRLRVPVGACDCHLHFYGSERRCPLAPSAPFPPPPAGVADYRRVQKELGLERVVVVQPTAYGKDNACTMLPGGVLPWDANRGSSPRPGIRRAPF